MVGWEQFYEVSDLGRARSWHKPAGKLLKIIPADGDGHLGITLYGAGRPRKRYIHNLILEAFIGPRPPELVGCHNDGNPANNILSNLRWDTKSSNSRDAVVHGRNVQANITRCPRGHLYSGRNLYINATSGGRACRSCQREHMSAWYRKRDFSIDNAMWNYLNLFGGREDELVARGPFLENLL